MPIFLLLNNYILLEFGFLFLHWHIKLYLFVMYNSVRRWIHTLWVGSSISLVNAFPLAIFVLRTFSILALSIVYTICYHPHSHHAVQRFLEVTSPIYLTINICLWLASFKAVSLLSPPATGPYSSDLYFYEIAYPYIPQGSEMMQPSSSLCVWI